MVEGLVATIKVMVLMVGVDGGYKIAVKNTETAQTAL